MSNTHSEFDRSEKKIDGDTYSVHLLNTSQALTIGESITKLVLPSAGAAVDGLFGDQSVLADEPATFTSITFHLVRQMGEVSVLDIIKKLLEGCTCNGELIDFERHFLKDKALLFKLVEFAIKENFGSLFTDMGLKEYWKNYTQLLTSQTQEPLNEEESQA